MRLTLVRNATLVVELAGRRLLVDPMLDPAGARPPVAGTPNGRPNPLVELPFDVATLVEGLDAIVVTHLHRDHLDDTAIRELPRGVPVLCQPADAAALAAHGLGPVAPVDDELTHDGLHVVRTGGRHGTGAIGERMAPVSGFVLRAGEEAVYIAGDTIWCDEVAEALRHHRPTVVVVNAGGARFLEGDPITMTAEDVVTTALAAAGAVMVAVHMEAINHCLLTRDELRAAAETAGVDVRVPEDGASLEE